MYRHYRLHHCNFFPQLSPQATVKHQTLFHPLTFFPSLFQHLQRNPKTRQPRRCLHWPTNLKGGQNYSLLPCLTICNSKDSIRPSCCSGMCRMQEGLDRDQLYHLSFLQFLKAESTFTLIPHNNSQRIERKKIAFFFFLQTSQTV